MAANFDKLCFLVVDDNVHMLKIVKTILRGFGAEHVIDARGAHEAFQRLKTNPVDIIVLDYLMGDEDGLEFLKKLRDEAKSPSPFVPVIMLTAHADKTRVEAARDAGATEFCAKPITAAEMLRKISSIIERPRPFVKAPRYFGPDRRRGRKTTFAGGERRRDRDIPPGSGSDG